jgi:hypothetical protein
VAIGTKCYGLRPRVASLRAVAKKRVQEISAAFLPRRSFMA